MRLKVQRIPARPALAEAGFVFPSLGDHPTVNTTTTRPPGAPVPMPVRQAFGFAPEPAADDDGDWKRLAAVNLAAREEATAFDAACLEVDGDGDLSDIGKAKRRQQLARQHEQVFERQAAMIRDAAQRLEAEGARIKSTLDAAGRQDERTTMLAVEYRATLRNMTHEARQAEVLEAIGTRDVTKLNAILGGLPQSSGLTDTGGGLLHLTKAALIAATHGPDTAGRLDRYAATIQAASQGVEAARGFIKRRAGA